MKTQAAPAVVPAKGISSPVIISEIIRPPSLYALKYGGAFRTGTFAFAYVSAGRFRRPAFQAVSESRQFETIIELVISNICIISNYPLKSRGNAFLPLRRFPRFVLPAAPPVKTRPFSKAKDLLPLSGFSLLTKPEVFFIVDACGPRGKRKEAEPAPERTGSGTLMPGIVCFSPQSLF